MFWLSGGSQHWTNHRNDIKFGDSTVLAVGIGGILLPARLGNSGIVLDIDHVASDVVVALWFGR